MQLGNNKTGKVIVIGSTPKSGISGGRLLAAYLAQDIAKAGISVTYLTTHKNDSIHFNGKALYKLLPIMKFVRPKIFYILLPFLALIVALSWLIFFYKKPYDTAIVVPELGRHELVQFYYYLARVSSNNVVLLNYETPNWFNEYAIEPRDEYLWKGWQAIGNKSDEVLSISKESMKYAKKYFLASTSHNFLTCPVVDKEKIQQKKYEARGKTITCIARADPHKGYNDIISILAQSNEIENINLIIGYLKGKKEKIKLTNIIKEKTGITPNICVGITDTEKFKLLADTRVLLFPSHFEGLGIPPIEALLSGCFVLAWDLPVFKEISERIETLPHGDFKAAGLRLDKLLAVQKGPAPDSAVNRYTLFSNHNNYREILHV